MTELTPAQDRAVRALVEQQQASGQAYYVHRMAPREVARVLWPDSPAWKRAANRHDGIPGARGATMPMLGARMLYALRDRGMTYVSPDHVWYLTREALVHAGAVPA